MYLPYHSLKKTMFSDPHKNLEQFELLPGMTVADLGSGSGFYTISAGKFVGDTGKVYSVDVQKDLLERTKNIATREHLHNIDIVWGDIEKMGGTKLRDFSVDRVILANVLFQSENKSGIVDETKRILKSGGKLLVVDWTGSFGGTGPAPQDVVTIPTIKKLFETAGFIFERNISAGEHHFGLIFKKL